MVVIRAPRYKPTTTVPTACIDGAKGDVRVTKSTDLVSRGSVRNDARRLRGFVRIIAGLGSCHKKEYQAPIKASFELKQAIVRWLVVNLSTKLGVRSIEDSSLPAPV
jgi:hypothetical protein